MQAWLSLVVSERTPVLEMCTTVAVTFTCSSSSVSILKGHVIIPVEGELGWWINRNTTELWMFRKPHGPKPSCSTRPLPQRGRREIYIKQEGQWREITITEMTTVEELLIDHEWRMWSLLYKGAVLAENLVLA